MNLNTAHSKGGIDIYNEAGTVMHISCIEFEDMHRWSPDCHCEECEFTRYENQIQCSGKC